MVEPLTMRGKKFTIKVKNLTRGERKAQREMTPEEQEDYFYDYMLEELILNETGNTITDYDSLTATDESEIMELVLKGYDPKGLTRR